MANQNSGRIVVKSGVSGNGKAARKAQPVKKGLRRLANDAKPQRAVCPIDEAYFEENATPLVLTIEGQEVELVTRQGEPIAFELEPLVYKTGTLGYMLNGVTTIMIGDEEVPVSFDFKVYLNGSKPKE